jgi:hypothetical protein
MRDESDSEGKMVSARVTALKRSRRTLTKKSTMSTPLMMIVIEAFQMKAATSKHTPMHW